MNQEGKIDSPSGAEETVPQLFFRPFGACVHSTFYPGLAPWAAFLRRFAAPRATGVPLFFDMRVVTQSLQGRVGVASGEAFRPGGRVSAGAKAPVICPPQRRAEARLFHGGAGLGGRIYHPHPERSGRREANPPAQSTPERRLQKPHVSKSARRGAPASR